MPSLKSYIQLKDKISSALTKPIAMAAKLDNTIEGVGNNNGLADAATQATNLGASVGGIDNGHLADTGRLIDAKNEQLRRTSREVGNATKKQGAFNTMLGKAKGLVSGLGSSIKKLGAAYMGFLSVRGLQRWVNSALLMVEQRQSIEVPLVVSMRNMGATVDEINHVRQLATDMQRDFAFSDTLFLAGATELSRNLSNPAGIESLKQSLMDITAGVNGVNATYQQMAANAQILGMALQGNFRQLERKGHSFSEAQQEILKTGTELERIAVLNEWVARRFGGMAEALTYTPAGRLAQIRNALNDITLEIGQGLQPAWMGIANQFHAHLPYIEAMMRGVGNAVIGGVNLFANHVFPVLLSGFSKVARAAAWVSDTITQNWGTIQPIILGIAIALGALAAVKSLLILKTGLLSVKKGILGLVMIKTPLGWMVVGIMAVSGAVIVAVKAFNHFADTTHSATGVIMGVLFTMGAFIFNKVIVPLWNHIAAFVNFFANVFNDPVAAIKILFLDLATNVLGHIASMARGLESLINMIPGVNINITSALDNLIAGIEVKASVIREESDWQQVMGTLDRWDYADAFQAGYQVGADFSLDGLFAGNEQNRFDPVQSLLDDIAGFCGATAYNTGLLAREVNIADEDLRYMRDIAEREAINYVTSQVIVPQFTVRIDTVRETADVDEIVETLKTKVEEEILEQPEGTFGGYAPA